MTVRLQAASIIRHFKEITAKPQTAEKLLRAAPQ